ncbi:putative OmpA/MotB protein [uncultured Alphaproteobacteria bacterium]|uniref:Putative OmpA/MotB protein n=1 Tax=uncultured Alphaproteobacteria bacterium TaxID=91750 RepID=A0A212JIM6_9PROT|nr:putative OmpA/MotB protein [uncultured Alphaproteobacteria bacterium]
MRFGADVWGGAGMWASRARGVGIAAFGGLLLAGCSWVGIGDDAPKPPQMIQPNAQAEDLPKGLSAEGGKRDYADGQTRSDVTVVRPLRTDAEPPKVSPAPKPAPVVQAAPPPAVAPAPAPAAAPAPAPQAAEAAKPASPDGALPPRAEIVPAGQAQPGAVAGPADLPGAPPAPAPVPGTKAAAAPAAQPAEDAMQSLDSFVPTRYAVSYMIASVPFGHGSTSLSSSDHALLRQVAAQYKKTGGALTVVGHASSRTGDMSALEHKLTNFDISVRRAEAVARDLTRMGVPARAVYVGAVSDNEPVSRETMPQGEAYNRRTEIFLNY